MRVVALAVMATLCGFTLSGVILLEIVSGRMYVTDYEGLCSYAPPDSSEWRSTIERRGEVVEDGAFHSELLDESYRGGWNRCFDQFIAKSVWHYSEVVSDPTLGLLGGNMVDTERVAGRIGWEDASRCIERGIEDSSERDMRQRVRIFNPVITMLSIGLIATTAVFVNLLTTGRKTNETNGESAD